MAAQPVFEVKNLSFSYGSGEPVLRDLSLTIPQGKITAVIGANGCGKSTLFRLLCGLHKPNSGEILLDGENIATIPRRDFAHKVSIVHQYNTAPDDITVEKLVAMGRTPYHGMLRGGLDNDDRDAIRRALQITDTEKYADKPVAELSGGQRQRVWLALALAQDTPVLLLDEITTYLDIYYQLQLLRLVRDLNHQSGLTVLMVLHDINQAIEFSDYTVMMKQGELLAAGETASTITGENLYRAFHIHTEVKTIDNKPYCIYR